MVWRLSPCATSKSPYPTTGEDKREYDDTRLRGGFLLIGKVVVQVVRGMRDIMKGARLAEKCLSRRSGLYPFSVPFFCLASQDSS